MRTPRYSDKVAAITGAASGIGRALAQRLAAAGCHVALSDVDETGLARTRDTVEKAASGVQVTTRRVDVADRAAMFAWAEEVADQHGRVNLVFNNAGVAHVGSVVESSLEDLEWLMNINFWGVAHGTKAFLPHLQRAGDGHVVNISSVFGIIGIPNQSAYNAAKFAVRGYTEALRQELDMMGGGVSATSVHPGGIDTNISRSGRVVERLASSKSKLDANFKKMARTSPDRAAVVILAAVRRNARRVLVGPDAYLIDAVQRLAPSAYQQIVKRLVPPTLRPSS